MVAAAEKKTNTITIHTHTHAQPISERLHWCEEINDEKNVHN